MIAVGTRRILGGGGYRLGLLALNDIPDFGNPLRRMVGSLEKIAGLRLGESSAHEPDEIGARGPPAERANEDAAEPEGDGASQTSNLPSDHRELIHA